MRWALAILALLLAGPAHGRAPAPSAEERMEAPRPGSPSAETTRADKSKADKPKADKPKADKPGAEPSRPSTTPPGASASESTRPGAAPSATPPQATANPVAPAAVAPESTPVAPRPAPAYAPPRRAPSSEALPLVVEAVHRATDMKARRFDRPPEIYLAPAPGISRAGLDAIQPGDTLDLWRIVPVPRHASTSGRPMRVYVGEVEVLERRAAIVVGHARKAPSAPGLEITAPQVGDRARLRPRPPPPVVAAPPPKKKKRRPPPPRTNRKALKRANTIYDL